TAPGGPDVNGAVTARFSLIRDQSGTTLLAGSSSNLPAGTDPLLDPTGLANNGGPTRTITPQPGSPLINTGSNPASLGTDQPGLPRSFGPTDIGAVEVQPAGTPAASGSFANVTTPGDTL